MNKKDSIKEKMKSNLEKYDFEAVKEGTEKAGEAIKKAAVKAGNVAKEKAIDYKDKAVQTKNEINDKLTELDRMLEEEITNYNDAYTLMNDKGIKLFVERSRAVDIIDNIRRLVNSIANRPKEFDDDFKTIETNRSNGCR